MMIFSVDVNKVVKTQRVMSQRMCIAQLTWAISLEESIPLWDTDVRDVGVRAS